MSPVSTVSQVFDSIQGAKAGAPAFCTNFFPTQSKLQGWIDQGELLGERRDRSAFFLRKDRDFWHLYFCAPDLATLQQEVTALPVLKTERVTIDLVGSEAVLGELLNVVGAAGFRRYARLIRLVRAGQPAQPQSSADGTEVLCADKSDCPAIINLLEGSFDRYADQLPALYEIEAAVAARQVLAVKRQGILAALLFFETQGFTSTVRYWVVDQRFRSHRFGSALMRHYLAAQSAVRRFILWVTADNEDAVLKYRHYGYAPDGLIDHVLVNEMIRP
jgi:ribosomal protein S18 acetylase RimI-like enzyme